MNLSEFSYPSMRTSARMFPLTRAILMENDWVTRRAWNDDQLKRQRSSQYDAPGFSGYMETESSIPHPSYTYHTPQDNLSSFLQCNYRCDSPRQNYREIRRNTPFNVNTSTSTYQPWQSYVSHPTQPQPVPKEIPLSFYPPYPADSSALAVPSGSRKNTRHNAEPALKATPQQLSHWDSSHFSPLFPQEWVNRSEYHPLDRKCEKCQCPSCQGVVAPKLSATGKRLHLCHIYGCGKTYHKTSHLKAHLNWHKGEQSYVCAWCGKTFTRSDERLRHTRTHTGEKNYACDKCNKKFMRSDHLNKHAKTHDNQKKKQNATAGCVDQE